MRTFNNTTVHTTTAMAEDFDAQIKALQAKRREQNKVEARANLVKVVNTKGVSNEQILEACYSFIGTHRLNTGTRRKKPEAVATQ